ncbi:hypothetical protein N7467_002613 [Penicillium canescens]|nr:hypothetical protein N7467_002613 [Penicillium canescens]
MARTRSQKAALQLMGPFTVSRGSATPHEDVKPEVAELDATLALQPPQLRHNERHQELPCGSRTLHTKFSQQLHICPPIYCTNGLSMREDARQPHGRASRNGAGAWSILDLIPNGILMLRRHFMA